MSSQVENPHDWVDAAIRDTGMAITGKHVLEPRRRVVIAAVSAHESYLWEKAEQAIGLIQEPFLRSILRGYTEVLLGKRGEQQ